MKIKKSLVFVLLGAIVVGAMLVSGCAPSQSGSTFSSDQARTAQTVEFGTITNLNNAVIDNKASGVGAVVGSVAGGVAGSTIGGGSGRVLAAVGGALVGAAAGHGVERAMDKSDALEITVRMDNTKRVISVVQQLGAEEKAFRVGQRVRVLSGNDGSTRVRPE